MGTALAFLFIAALISLLINAVRAIWRSRRLSAKRWSIGSAVVAVASFIAFAIISDGEQNAAAVSRGFVDAADLRAAKQNGIEDARAWKIKKADLEAEAAKVREAEAKKVEAERAAAAVRKAEEDRLAAVKATECERDLQCIGDKKTVAVGVYCKDPVERLAKYQAEWTDSWYEPKFTRFRWKDRSQGIATFIGDKVKFQNGFGAWQMMIYECDFDIKNDRPVAVRAQAGRLP